MKNFNWLLTISLVPLAIGQVVPYRDYDDCYSCAILS